ncbi:MAG: MarR family winged helix-turn-helix transcriptional regulator [Candidatus Eiseniibacteriota bacterium]
MERRLREEIQQSKPFASLEEEVFLEIQRTAQVQSRWVVEALQPSGLTPSQFNVLRILRGARPDALSSSRIAERMVTHDPDLTRLLDRLEARELISKTRDARDRRVVNVRVTAAGLKIVESASKAVGVKLRTELRPLGPRKLEALADLLELVRDSTA